jgi:hypothetical protein
MREMPLNLPSSMSLLNDAVSVLTSESTQPHWWQVTTGILAIPAAIIGLVYSYILVKKTRLETVKMELEIREKQSQVAKLAFESHVAGSSAVVHDVVVEPVVQGRIVQFILLRFIVLYLVLGFWGAIEDAFGFVLAGAMLASTRLFHTSLDSLWVIIPVLIVQQLPTIVHWLLFVAIGWPLFVDVNKMLGLRLKDLLSIKGFRGTTANTDKGVDSDSALN